MSTIRFQINLERTIRYQGGSLRWPVHIVMLICEILVNGNPPSAIPYNIQTMSAALTVSEVNYPQSLDYERKCCIVVQNINNILAACGLVKSEN